MQQLVRVYDVPLPATAGHLWCKPVLPTLERARYFVAECAMRALGFAGEAQRFRRRRTDHIAPFEFDGVEWGRPYPDGTGREFISACGCWSGFGIRPSAAEIGAKVGESMAAVIDARLIDHVRT